MSQDECFIDSKRCKYLFVKLIGIGIEKNIVHVMLLTYSRSLSGMWFKRA